MSVRTRVTGLLAASLVAATCSVGIVAGPSQAATGTAPVTAADTATVLQGTTQLVDVLANDTDADGDVLQVCRIGALPDGLDVQPLGTSPSGPVAYDSSTSTSGPATGQLLVTGYGKPGTYTVTYYACDLSYLTAGTLTVRVDKAPRIKIKVTKLGDRPGKLKVVNRTGVRVRFAWGRYGADQSDGLITVGHRAKVIDVRRTSIFWVAYSPYTPTFKLGAVRDIRLPRGTRALPPGAPKGKVPSPFDNGAAEPLRLRSWVS